MPNLQTTVPPETAAAIQAKADSRVPKDSVSRVIAEVLIPAFQPKADALRAVSKGGGKKTATPK